MDFNGNGGGNYKYEKSLEIRASLSKTVQDVKKKEKEIMLTLKNECS